MRNLVKKLDASARLAPAMLARAPSFAVPAGALADSMHEVLLSNGETVHLHLPHHTHLNPGDVLLDSMGMMVRVDAAKQAVIAVAHEQAQALVSLALSAHKQGRALGWDGQTLLLAQDAQLAQYLEHAGFTVTAAQGLLAMPLAALPMPEHSCGHDHEHSHHAAQSHDHNHGHEHSHTHDHGHNHAHTGHGYQH